MLDNLEHPCGAPLSGPLSARHGAGLILALGEAAGYELRLNEIAMAQLLYMASEVSESQPHHHALLLP